MTTTARPVSERVGAGSRQSLYFDLAATVRTSGLLDRRRAWYWWQILSMVAAFALVWVGVVGAGQLVVPAVARCRARAGRHPVRLPGPRRRAPADLPVADVERVDLPAALRRLRRPRLRLVARQAQPPPRQPQQGGPRPRHRQRGLRLHPRRRGVLHAGSRCLVRPPPGLAVLPPAHPGGPQPARRRHPQAAGAPHRRRTAGWSCSWSAPGSRRTSWRWLVLLPPGKAVAFFGVQMAVFGLCLGGSFAPSHKGMPIVPPTAKIDFLRRQVLTSRNVRGSILVDFLMGGLDYQIEHHLFPSMPRPNLKRAQPIVRAYCAEHGVPYAEVGLLSPTASSWTTSTTSACVRVGPSSARWPPSSGAERAGERQAPSRRCGQELELRSFVGLTGFEPAASSSRTRRATKLRHSPMPRRAGRV